MNAVRPRLGRAAAVLLAAAAVPVLLATAARAYFGDAQYPHAAAHELLEGAGSCVALAVGALLFIRLRYDATAPYLLWVVSALVAMGLIDGVHGMTPWGPAFAWTRQAATLVGGTMLALTWLRPPAFALRHNGAFIAAVALAALSGALALWWRADALPAPWTVGRHNVAAMTPSLLGGLGFFASAAFFLRRYRKSGLPENLVFASQNVLFGTAGFVSGFSPAWGADWWAWHAVRLSAYVIALGAACAVVVSLYRRIAGHADELARHVESRTAELRGANEALRSEIERRTLLEAESARGREELRRVNAELRDSHRAALNLMQDAVDANRELRREIELRRQADAENSALMLRNQALVSELGEILYEWQPRLDRLRWDGEYTRILGYTADEMGGDRASWTSRVHGDDLERVVAEVRKAMSTHGHYDLEYRFRRRNGSYAWIREQGVPMPGPDGETERVLAVFRDISTRKQVEIVQSRLAAIVDSSADAIIGRTLDGEVTSWNAAAERLFGHDASEMIGAPIARLIPPERLDEEAQLMQRIARGERIAAFDTVRLHRDGRRIDVALTLSPIEDANGRVVGVAAIARDVGELRRAHDQIRSLNADLEQRVSRRTAELEAANKELESFAYSVSHDLRAPLRAIDGFSRILADEHDAELSPAARELLQLIRTAAQQMGELIGDLLTFSKLSRQPLHHDIVQPEVQVRECLDLLRAERDGREIALEIGALPACEGDAGLLKVVWLNLLSNAFKYTRRTAAARIEVGCRDPDGEPTYYVRDNGVGFNMAYADKLFGVFQRLHRSEDYEGTGVGLATAQRIVLRHGGRIWAEAELNRGATFFFNLPRGATP